MYKRCPVKLYHNPDIKKNLVTKKLMQTLVKKKWNIQLLFAQKICILGIYPISLSVDPAISLIPPTLISTEWSTPLPPNPHVNNSNFSRVSY